MRKLLLSSFLFMLCLPGIGIADVPAETVYYPGDNLFISLPTEEIPSDDIQPPVEEQTNIRSLATKTQHSLMTIYNRLPAGNFPKIPTLVRGFCSTPSGNILVQPSQNSRNSPVTHAAPSPSISIIWAWHQRSGKAYRTARPATTSQALLMTR